MTLNFSNYKLTIRIIGEISELSLSRFLENHIYFTKKWHNIFSLRDNKYSYIIFKNGTVNVTKIKNLRNEYRDVYSRLQTIFSAYDEHINFSDYIIDSITATLRHFPFPYNEAHMFDFRLLATFLHQRKKDLEENFFNSAVTYRYNSEIFPGFFIKFASGTCVIFSSGTINFIGFKSEEDIRLKAKKMMLLFNIMKNI